MSHHRPTFTFGVLIKGDATCDRDHVEAVLSDVAGGRPEFVPTPAESYAGQVVLHVDALTDDIRPDPGEPFSKGTLCADINVRLRQNRDEDIELSSKRL